MAHTGQPCRNSPYCLGSFPILATDSLSHQQLPKSTRRQGSSTALSARGPSGEHSLGRTLGFARGNPHTCNPRLQLSPPRKATRDSTFAETGCGADITRWASSLNLTKPALLKSCMLTTPLGNKDAGSHWGPLWTAGEGLHRPRGGQASFPEEGTETTGRPGPTPTCWLELVSGCGQWSMECRSNLSLLGSTSVSYRCCSHGPTGTASREDTPPAGGTGKFRS